MFVSAWEKVTIETIQNCFKYRGNDFMESVAHGVTDNEGTILLEKWNQISGLRDILIHSKNLFIIIIF